MKTGSDEVRETEKISSFSTSVSSLMVRLAHLMVPMEVLGGNTKGTSSSRTKSMGSTSWEDRTGLEVTGHIKYTAIFMGQNNRDVVSSFKEVI